MGVNTITEPDEGSVSPFRGSARRPDAKTEATLGPLEGLPGTWVGGGLALRTWLDRGVPRFQISATRESMTFAAVVLPGAGEDTDGEPTQLPGVYFLHRANDVTTRRAVHVESGTWMNLPVESDQRPGPSLARISRRLHSDPIVAYGTHLSLDGAPEITPVDWAPLANAGATPLQIDLAGEDARLPPELDREALRDPTILLRRSVEAHDIAGFTLLTVHATDTDAGPAPLVAPAMSIQNPHGTNIELTVWVERTRHAARPHERLQLQYLRREVVNASGIAWPQVSLATLEKQ